MANALDTAVSVVLVVATATISASYAYRTFIPRPALTQPAELTAPIRMPNADAEARYGYTIVGDSTAPNTLIEFGDLECPACRAFHEILQSVVTAHPSDLRVVYVSFPLTYHRFALPAARAADCAASVGGVGRWIDAVYAKQDSLGLKSWGSFAQDAGIADTSRIATCATTAGMPPQLDSAMASAKRLAINGTPTIAVDGWIFPRVPSAAQIDSAIAHTNSLRSSPRTK